MRKDDQKGRQQASSFCRLFRFISPFPPINTKMREWGYLPEKNATVHDSSQGISGIPVMTYPDVMWYGISCQPDNQEHYWEL
jgi:hypothetical protein